MDSRGKVGFGSGSSVENLNCRNHFRKRNVITPNFQATVSFPKMLAGLFTHLYRRICFPEKNAKEIVWFEQTFAKEALVLLRNSIPISKADNVLPNKNSTVMDR